MTTTTRRPRPIADHGTLSRYKYHGCKCLTCRVAYSEYATKRRRQSAYGTWQPFTPAAPVRQHVMDLQQAGIPVDAVTEAASVTRQTLARIVYGIPAGKPTQKIRKESAEAILRVSRADCQLGDGTRLDGTGTRRRIQALVAAGWSFVVLAKEMGFNDRALASLARADRVTVATARKVKDGYKRLNVLTPEQYGVRPHAQSLARTVAAREGWVTAAAWDNIDDPNCAPDADAEAGADTEIARAAYRREEVTRLHEYRTADHEIAQRLGMAISTVRGIITELESGQRRNRKRAAA
ncbi:hypothetical protein [Streptomyces sp. 020-2-3H-GM]|uniref:hypothetical protein n=1 Tax=Streptomyces sp. 020-2-3H-GM TaxID=2789258 RepID=UPI003980FD62